MGITDKNRGTIAGGAVLYLGSHRLMWGSAAPSAGAFTVGDICFNTAPTASTATDMGWVCTVSGSPGTWEPWGDIGT